ncbi:hypothetical protein P3X46_013299 [Hevea brasiliensis]|uniref:TF-B3 domain-containing protein n=1 Tax=Hevea brasiliensis TaxID=3981 RepID=A0ABQ9M5G3_HEVBR|nr:hypothetical protein P3X46_013299 [Hevea brasiliensis]
MEQTLLFTKQLSLTDVTSYLSVPSGALQFFSIPEGAHSMEFEARDITGFIWRYRLSTRSTGRYPKPYIVRSLWLPFVEQKGLAPNDKVMFFLTQDEENGIRYRVKAQRKIVRLFGFDFWVDVEALQHYYDL